MPTFVLIHEPTDKNLWWQSDSFDTFMYPKSNQSYIIINIKEREPNVIMILKFIGHSHCSMYVPVGRERERERERDGKYYLASHINNGMLICPVTDPSRHF